MSTIGQGSIDHRSGANLLAESRSIYRVALMVLPIFYFALLYHPLFAQGDKESKHNISRHSSNYTADVVIVKLESEKGNKGFGKSGIRSIEQSMEVLSITPVFHSYLKPSSRSRSSSPIDRIYKIKLTPGYTVEEAIEKLKREPSVSYAEPQYRVHLLYVPNDPEAAVGTGQQYYLDKIKAYDAWGIERGNKNVVIGILDTGASPEHEDLKNSIAVNTADPVNGIDDDRDGYVDNYIGWDMADNDNDPTADGHRHGTLVAGIANAEADNGTGIAGVGFNSSFLPIKIFTTAETESTNAYEAIVYAADHGCDVINLSWGGIQPYSQFEQDIINYAVLEKDAVVIAAAGNDNLEIAYYPASYDNVVSVAFTDAMDIKAPRSTYSPFVDLTAPGLGIYTTDFNGSYRRARSGSSLATPMVSGAAALLRAKFPDYTAQQIAAQLRASTDDIYNLDGNAPYFRKLGKGRLNIAQALSDKMISGIALESYAFNYDEQKGQVYLTVTLKNYLSPSGTKAKATLRSDSPFITVVDSVFEVGTIPTLDSSNNSSAPFRIKIDPELKVGNELPLFPYLTIEIEDGEQWDYATIEFNTSDIRVTEFAFRDEDATRNTAIDDTLGLKIGFGNYLFPSANTEVVLSSNTPGVTVIDSLFVLGEMKHLKDTIVQKGFFNVLIDEGFDMKKRNIEFTMQYKNSSWLFVEYFELSKEHLSLEVPWPDFTESWSIVPNPNQGNFSLQNNNPTSGRYTITDIMGKTMVDGNLDANRADTYMDMPDLETGVYLMQIEDANGKHLLRFIVTH